VTAHKPRQGQLRDLGPSAQALTNASCRVLVARGYSLSVVVAVSCCLGTPGCGSLPVSSARLSKLRDAIARVSAAGALACAPRELALARAHYGFAQSELRNGEVDRAQQHLDEAELNLGAAQVLTPARGCGREAEPNLPRRPLGSDARGQLAPAVYVGSADLTEVTDRCRRAVVLPRSLGSLGSSAEADGCNEHVEPTC